MGHRSAQVFVKIMLFGCLVASLSWLATSKEVHADDTTSVIVELANGIDATVVAAEHNATIARTIPTLSLFLFESSQSDILSQLAQDARVAAVYEDTIVIGQPRFAGAVGNELDAQPWGSDSDPSTAFTEQWAIANIRLADAHGITQGDGITVAVLDTGVDFSHEQLQGKLIAGYDFVDNDDTPTEERNELDDDGDLALDEGAGHGTHVAGIIALTAPQANIMPIRIFDDEGKGLYFDMIQGFIYAVDNGADVINLSGSGPDDIPFLADAIAYAEANGVIVVAAGGVNSLGYPAGYDSVISVGASDEQNYPTDFSTFPILSNTVYAPGFSILSGYDDGSYAIWSGNSMATPFVAGTAALLLATDTCDAACAKSLILDTAHPVVINPETNEQHGRVDAFDAVSSAVNQAESNLRVNTMNGDFDLVADNQMNPYFSIVNYGNSLPLSELTLRYWFTNDGNAEQTVDCDYAAIACDMVAFEIGSAETAVSNSYLELSFPPDAGVLFGTQETGSIQVRIHNTDWANYNELDDYSYSGSTSFIESQQVTLYHNGTLVWGEEPTAVLPATPVPTTEPTAVPEPTAAPTLAPTATPQPTQTPQATQTPQPTQAPPQESVTVVPPSTTDIRVQYHANNTNLYDGGIQPALQLVNDSGSEISLPDFRIRYWLTDVETVVINPYCDYAVIQCANVTAITGKNGTQHYLDVTFTAAAGTLAPSANTGTINLRLHHSDWSPLDESDDYSFSAAAATFADSQNITLYRNGELIWGVEP